MNGTGNMEDISAETVPSKAFADHSIKDTWGYTYFVRREDLIKIGHTGAPQQRIGHLGQPREVLAIVPNTIVDEPTAHHKFAHLRERGEWFRAAPDLLAFIEEVKGKADAMPKREYANNTEFDDTRRDLIALAVKYGSGTPVSNRSYSLVQMIRNFQRTTDRETKAWLLVGIQKKTRELANLIAAAP